MKQHLLILILVVAATVFSSHAQQPLPKPPVGVPADAKSFNGKWYRVYLEKGGWRQAKGRCSVLGGQLAVILDEPTHAFIAQLAEGIPLWLGATDEKIEGVWQWVDGTRVTFAAWAPGQPQGAPKENYMAMFGGQWHDTFENEPKVVGFICEWLRK